MAQAERAAGRVARPVADVAYAILKQHGQPVAFKDLVAQVLEAQGSTDVNPRGLAAIHTEINLDNRFVHLGGGQWGLASWSPSKRKVKVVAPAPARPKPLKPAWAREDLLADPDEEEEAVAAFEEEAEEFPEESLDGLDDEDEASDEDPWSDADRGARPASGGYPGRRWDLD